MANLQSETVILGSDSFTSLASPAHRVATRGIDKQGRWYRYVKVGASDLVAGNALQSPAIIANHLANTPPAVAIGATSFSYTPGATAGAAGIYENGFLQVDTTPGNGYTYGVDSHPAITASTAFQLTLKSDDPIQVALTTSSRVGLLQNIYNGVIQFPVTTATGLFVGVATYPLTANQYGWILTKGPASTLINGTPALGAMVVTPSATTAGSVDVITTTNLVTAQIVGRMLQVGVSGKNNFVYVSAE